MHPSVDQERDPHTESLIGTAIEVHRHLGPGLLESMYETGELMRDAVRRLVL